MTSLEKANAYVSRLVAANIRATTDPKNLNPPCVLFTPPAQIVLDLQCGGSAEMRALLIVPGPSAWAQLDALLAAVVDVLPAETVTATSWDAADNTPLPAYELSWVEAVSLEGET